MVCMYPYHFFLRRKGVVEIGWRGDLFQEHLCVSQKAQIKTNSCYSLYLQTSTIWIIESRRPLVKPPGSCLKGFRRNVQMRSESLLGRVAQQCTKWRTPSLSFQKVTVGYSKRILYNLWVTFCLTAVGGHLFSLPFFFSIAETLCGSQGIILPRLHWKRVILWQTGRNHCKNREIRLIFCLNFNPFKTRNPLSTLHRILPSILKYL